MNVLVLLLTVFLVEELEIQLLVVHVQTIISKKVIDLVLNVIIGVKNVKPDLINVDHVQLVLTESILILVDVKMVSMITELKSVNHVIQNVSLVSMLLLVLLVKVTEAQPENVHVH
jgi:hypothetical protein